MTVPVTVVVPVYGGGDDVARCLESVVRHRAVGATEFDVLVIDDASPDPAVRSYLEGLADVTVLHNEENLGFVRTCNRAFAETVGDVVLLNSDTVVTAGWLDGLCIAAGQPDVASVTPLTNFGSICTLPESVIAAFDLNGATPRIDECAEFIREHSPCRRPEVITGVGFCMYVTRAALDACGPFDDQTFGAGYGEEVDFCLRASVLGFRHLADDATFVYHRGGGSFAEARQEGLKRSSELLHRRYPYFRTMNLAERAEDPLRVSFAALELGLAPRRPERPHVLQVLHSSPGQIGGSEKHLLQLMHGMLDEIDCSILQPVESGRGRGRRRDGFLLSTFWNTGDGAPVSHEFLIPADDARGNEIDDPAAATALRTVLDMFDFDAVHLQNIFNHSLAPLAVLADFDGPVVCSVRDMYLACPHHWLLYRNRDACGIPDDLSYCARCLPETRGLDVAYLQAFRETVASRLDTVDHWVFASQSAVDFLLRVYDLDPARVVLIEHGAIIDHRRSTREVDPGRVLDEPLRVGFVGIGWAKKGLPAVNELAAAFAGSSIELHHFGELREAISPLVHTHGTYDNNVLPELLARAGIQVVLLPGPFVETFGHVMTESIGGGVPVIGNRTGALGERIRTHEVGWTVDPEDVGGMRELIENLDRCRPEVLRATTRAVEMELRSVEATADRYAALYLSPRHPGRAGPRGRTSVNDDEHLRRELRAMAAANRQLYAQLTEAKKAAAARPPSRGAEPSKAPRGLAAQARRVRRVVQQRGVGRAGRDAGQEILRRLRQVVGS